MANLARRSPLLGGAPLSDPMRRKQLTPLVFIVVVAAASLVSVLATDRSP